jgi:hypothetical protein
MKSKLIEIITNEMYKQNDLSLQKCDEVLCNAVEYLGEKIADELIVKGIIIPPCKVGDTFYGIQGNNYFQYCVKAIKITTKGLCFETIYGMTFIYGEDAFLTEYEAQAKIKED